MQTIFKFYLFVSFLFFSGLLFAHENEKDERDPCLKLNRDGIKVYVYRCKDSDFATFKAITYIKASLDSILAVMFDNKAGTDWIYACDESFIIENIDFNERYHYQVTDIPFPFVNRDFIFHSIMKQDPLHKTIIISMTAAADYCNNKSSIPCEKVNESNLVRVKESVGTYQLESDDNVIKVTWIQHTNLAGHLPNWLVNQFVTDTPYWTLKNLAEKVKEEKYKHARLIYNDNGIATALKVPTIKPAKSAKDFPRYPTF